ncbi:hypothetical protein [Halorussus litoreus]|uniref:hypothetical protein n=1 Tax=Halorussus litoreus TaxID=1710536 RepID=UPI000E24501E|nr:hypothetical protein [Halorussus litoreus]
MNRRKLLKSIGAGGLIALGAAGSAGAKSTESVEQVRVDQLDGRLKLPDGSEVQLSTDDDCPPCIADDCTGGCPTCCDYCIC